MNNNIYYIDFELTNTTKNILNIYSEHEKDINQIPIYYRIGTLDKKCSNFFCINFENLNPLINKFLNFNDNQISEKIIKELQNEILNNINEEFNEKFKSLDEINFIMWRPSDIERKIIPIFSDSSKTINNKIMQDEKNKINSFDELIYDLENLRKENEKFTKKSKNNKLVNLCISIIYQRKYEWIELWDKYDKEKIDALDCEKLNRFLDAICQYTKQEYEIFFNLWSKLDDK